MPLYSTYQYRLLALFAFVLPLSLDAAHFCLGINLIYWLFNIRSTQPSRLVSPLAIFTICFYLVHVFTLFYSDIPSGFAELLTASGLLIFPLILFTIPPPSSTDIRHIFLAFLIACCITFCICFFKSLFDYHKIGAVSYLYYSWLSGHMNFLPAYFGLYAVTAFFILFKIMYHDWAVSSSPRKIAGIFGSFFLFYIAIMSSARLVVATFLLLLILTFLVWMQKRRLLIAGMISVVLVLFVMQAVASHFFITRSRFIDRNFRSTAYRKYEHNFFININDPRGQVWESAFILLEDMPFGGYGIGNDVDDLLSKVYAERGYKKLIKIKANAHNQYLQTFLATGVPGLFFLLAMMIYPIFLSWKSKNYVYLLIILMMLIPMLTETMLATSHGILFFAFWNHFLGRSL